MNVSVSIDIAKPKENVWCVISDIEHSNDFISAIIGLEVLERPSTGMVG